MTDTSHAHGVISSRWMQACDIPLMYSAPKKMVCESPESLARFTTSSSDGTYLCEMSSAWSYFVINHARRKRCVAK